MVDALGEGFELLVLLGKNSLNFLSWHGFFFLESFNEGAGGHVEECGEICDALIFHTILNFLELLTA